MRIPTPVIVGAIGGFFPAFASFYGVTIESIIKNPQLNEIIIFLVKSLMLAAVGGLLVWLNRETDRLKAFQIGLTAPALIVSILNGNTVSNLNSEIKDYEKRQIEMISKEPATTSNTISIPEFKGARFDFLSPRTAHAAEEKPAMKSLHNEKPDLFSRLLYSITGISDRGWFVIAGSSKDRDKAKEIADDFKKRGYDAEVKKPFGSSEYYSVMIGSWLTKEEAQKIRDRAIKDGLPKDTYIWKFKP